MAELLLEIYSEEIPSRMQNKAATDFKKIFEEFLTKQNIEFSDQQINCYVTPRRLTLVAQNLPENQITPAAKKIGPKIDAPEKAIEGFLKSVGAKNINDLSKITNQNGEYYCFESQASRIEISVILQKNLPAILQKMAGAFPKLMRWNADKSKSYWIRPIRNLLCIFNSEIIAFEFAGLNSNNKSFGHLFLSPEVFEVNNFEGYQQKLLDNFVILDSEKRKEIIKTQIKEICKKINCHAVDNLQNDNALLNEVAGLVEFPEVLLGQIDQKFMSLPYEVLVLTLKLHQKYFCLKDQNNNLAPYFIFVSNIKTANPDKIIKDNQKVLSARLSDAKFFIEEDLKLPLIQRLEGLKNIIFHEKIGSIYDKSKRLGILNRFIAIWISGANLSLAERLADLAKNDLITKTVAELPELQGIIGSYYAKMQNEPEEISNAIAEQYLPVGINSDLPKTPLGILLSISDKIDTICALFLIGEKPTSSKDPFALRRAALGIIRIMITNQINLPLRIIIEKSINSFDSKIIKNSYPDKDAKNLKIFKQDLTLEIIGFFAERLKFFLKDNVQLRADIVSEVFDQYLANIKNDKKCNLFALVGKSAFINQFVLNSENHKIIELYKRAANIVNIEEKKDQKQYSDKLHLMILKNKYDKLLLKSIKQITPKLRKALKKQDLKTGFELLNKLEMPLNYFFDHNMVNCPEENLRITRLIILAKIRDLFNEIFNFSKIEIKKV